MLSALMILQSAAHNERCNLEALSTLSYFVPALFLDLSSCELILRTEIYLTQERTI